MENLQPAISIVDKLTEVSPQEFQQMLSAWFEEKGIISELRSHAKYQMINVLKTTSIGKKLGKTPSQTSTLAQQALHLIVAEYLIQNHCHYSFSLFSSEVNLAKVFAESKLLLNTRASQGDQPSTLFDKENFKNILELIGISKTSEEHKEIFQSYYNSEKKTSILSCLISLINSKNTEDLFNEDLNVDFEDDFLQKVSQILLSSSVPKKTYNKVILEIQKCYEVKAKSFEHQCMKLINKFREELSIRNSKLHSCNKKKKRLEKQLLKSTQDQKNLKERIALIDEKDLEKKDTENKVSCGLDHCSDQCQATKEICENYQKENECLKHKNEFQKEEIKKLMVNYDHLKQELLNCQTKINLLKVRLQEQSTNGTFNRCHSKAQVPDKGKNLNTESSEGSSNNLTEEILKEARRKLFQLEEESEQIDQKYRSFLNT